MPPQHIANAKAKAKAKAKSKASKSSPSSPTSTTTATFSATSLLQELQEHNDFFDDLVDMIPAKLYIANNTGKDCADCVCTGGGEDCVHSLIYVLLVWPKISFAILIPI